MMSHGTCPYTLLHIISLFTNNTHHAAQHTKIVSLYYVKTLEAPEATT